MSLNFTIIDPNGSVIIYTRVSTKQQNADGCVSLAMQEQVCKDILHSHLRQQRGLPDEYKIAAIATHIGSGYSNATGKSNIEILADKIKKIKDPEKKKNGTVLTNVNKIVVMLPDRFSRNLKLVYAGLPLLATALNSDFAIISSYSSGTSDKLQSSIYRTSPLDAESIQNIRSIANPSNIVTMFYSKDRGITNTDDNYILAGISTGENFSRLLSARAIQRNLFMKKFGGYMGGKHWYGYCTRSFMLDDGVKINRLFGVRGEQNVINFIVNMLAYNYTIPSRLIGSPLDRPETFTPELPYGNLGLVINWALCLFGTNNHSFDDGELEQYAQQSLIGTPAVCGITVGREKMLSKAIYAGIIENTSRRRRSTNITHKELADILNKLGVPFHTSKTDHTERGWTPLDIGSVYDKHGGKYNKEANLWRLVYTPSDAATQNNEITEFLKKLRCRRGIFSTVRIGYNKLLTIPVTTSAIQLLNRSGTTVKVRQPDGNQLSVLSVLSDYYPTATEIIYEIEAPRTRFSPAGTFAQTVQLSNINKIIKYYNTADVEVILADKPPQELDMTVEICHNKWRTLNLPPHILADPNITEMFDFPGGLIIHDFASELSVVEDDIIDKSEIDAINETELMMSNLSISDDSDSGDVKYGEDRVSEVSAGPRRKRSRDSAMVPKLAPSSKFIDAFAPNDDSSDPDMDPLQSKLDDIMSTFGSLRVSPATVDQMVDKLQEAIEGLKISKASYNEVSEEQ